MKTMQSAAMIRKLGACAVCCVAMNMPGALATAAPPPAPAAQTADSCMQTYYSLIETCYTFIDPTILPAIVLDPASYQTCLGTAKIFLAACLAVVPAQVPPRSIATCQLEYESSLTACKTKYPARDPRPPSKDKTPHPLQSACVAGAELVFKRCLAEAGLPVTIAPPIVTPGDVILTPFGRSTMINVKFLSKGDFSVGAWTMKFVFLVPDASEPRGYRRIENDTTLSGIEGGSFDVQLRVNKDLFYSSADSAPLMCIVEVGGQTVTIGAVPAMIDWNFADRSRDNVLNEADMAILWDELFTGAITQEFFDLAIAEIAVDGQ